MLWTEWLELNVTESFSLEFLDKISPKFYKLNDYFYGTFCIFHDPFE